jgi:CheY-like chemotaxis protein
MAAAQELWEDLCEMTEREAGFAVLMNPAFTANIHSAMNWFVHLPPPHDEFELQQRYLTHIEMVEDWSKQARSAEQPPEKQGRRRVMIVDDNADAAKLLAMVVQFIGHEVKTAFDGVEAVQVAEQFLPDMIIMDIGMPIMNGYDAAQRIRSQPWGTKIFLVALTGRGEEEVRHKAREAGFDHHLVKPVTPEALKELLASAFSDSGPSACES